MKLLWPAVDAGDASCLRASSRPRSMPDHTRAEVEGDDKGQRLIRPAREDSSLVGH